MPEKKIPYHNKPDDLTLDEWQLGLRRQYAQQQKFKFKNIGNHVVYSDFEVYNPITDNTYKVSLRDGIDSFNFCSCPDFKINTLGNCKHIEYLLHYFSRYKKYQKHLSNPRNPDQSSLSIVYNSERNIRLEKASRIDTFRQQEEFFDDFGFMKPGMLSKIDSFIASAKEVDPEFTVYPDVIEYISHFKKKQRDKALCEQLFSKGINSKIFNNLIKATLYNYQKQGVQQIVEKGRVLLADEMGLGKTIQAIAATEILVSHFGVENVLIICPTSLKFQWKREIEKFSDKKSTVVEGAIHKRKDLYKSDALYKIISYGVCRTDLDLINSCQYDLIIIDEAQRIKNWKTKTAQAVKKIQGEYAIILTGTPLENKIDELHSIVEYVDRYKLGPLFRFLHNHQMLDEWGKLKGYKNLREINSTLQDILLRRTKKEIQDQLPGRMDKNYFVELTKEQQADHDSYYDHVCRLVNKWIRQGMLSESDRQKLLMFLSCMRMVCNSTYILNEKTNHGNKVGEFRELLGELLQNAENKIVIFSQWKRMFDLIIRELDKLKIPFVYLNGDIPAQQRKQIIDAFQDHPDIKIFLSTDAGGVGVNLQSANNLINLDIPWNPAVLEQRIARIYRLGQKKHVSIFNFIAERSIEHRILHLLEFKRTVFNGVIEEDGQDTVMMESFLESIKALTEVKLETSETEENTARNFNKRTEIYLAEEINDRLLQEQVNQDKTASKLFPGLANKIMLGRRSNAHKENSIITRIKNRVRRIIGIFGD